MLHIKAKASTDIADNATYDARVPVYALVGPPLPGFIIVPRLYTERRPLGTEEDGDKRTCEWTTRVAQSSKNGIDGTRKCFFM